MYLSYQYFLSGMGNSIAKKANEDIISIAESNEKSLEGALAIIEREKRVFGEVKKDIENLSSETSEFKRKIKMALVKAKIDVEMKLLTEKEEVFADVLKEIKEEREKEVRRLGLD